MHKKNLAMAVSASLGSLAAAGSAIAQETTVFEPVIVTAQKREQSIYDVPVAISAFTAETIEKQGITNLTDIGKFVPNLNVTEFSAGHTSSANPFIRGIGLQDHLITTDPGVGVYVDGVYLGRQVGQNWSLANIERVEVLRGPQGTLYGRNSIGGAINIITREARRRGRRPGLADGGLPRPAERGFLHEHGLVGPARAVRDGRLPAPRRPRPLPAAREPAQGSRRDGGHLRRASRSSGRRPTGCRSCWRRTPTRATAACVPTTR